jgi:hypothetical protein
MARETRGTGSAGAASAAPAADAATTATDAPDTTSTPGGGTAPADPVGRQGLRSSRGGQTIGVEYGNPYDENVPPWPVYNDPTREVMAEREKEEQRLAKLQADAEGAEYRFTGHRDDHEGTETLITSVGRVEKGESIKLSDDEVAKARSFGFKLTKVGE